MTLVAMLVDSVSEIVVLEILKFDVVAMANLDNLCNLLFLRLKATSLAVSF